VGLMGNGEDCSMELLGLLCSCVFFNADDREWTRDAWGILIGNTLCLQFCLKGCNEF
jgi:hypothetical protein